MPTDKATNNRECVKITALDSCKTKMWTLPVITGDVKLSRGDKDTCKCRKDGKLNYKNSL